MLNSGLLLPAVINGLAMGAVYALIALGLTLIYGVLHIINFAHGSLLMLALYAAFFLNVRAGVDPYVALLTLMPSGLFVSHSATIEPIAASGRENMMMNGVESEPKVRTWL